MARTRVSSRRARAPRKFKLHKPHWIDPYPHIPGTEPEKRIFEALIRLGIYFIYQGQAPELERGVYVTLAIPGYKPDFVLPEQRVILDPFSPFHHSLAEAVERDFNKKVLYTALGYEFIHPWAVAPGIFVLKQETPPLTGRYVGALALLLAIPALRAPARAKLTDPRDVAAKIARGYRIGQYVGAGATSVGAANRSRRKPPALGIRAGTRRSRR